MTSFGGVVVVDRYGLFFTVLFCVVAALTLLMSMSYLALTDIRTGDYYTLILFAVSLLPFSTRMSGVIYLAAAVALGGTFLWYAVRIYTDYSDRLAHKTFRYSIVYLSALFTALLVDHYFGIVI